MHLDETTRARVVGTTVALVVMLAACQRRAGDVGADDLVIAFENGAWFDGTSFELRDYYAAGGLLYESPPAPIDSTVDLAGEFVIPPFGDAHAHLVAPPAELTPILDSLRRRGIFYVRNQNNALSTRTEIGELVNAPGGIEFAFSNGGMTSTLGHPMYLTETMALGLFDPGAQREALEAIRVSRTGDGDAYFRVDSDADLEEVWGVVLAGQPDAVKVYLLDSERYDQTILDDDYVGRRGLSPALVASIVERAHAAGVPVTAHVETAFDFGVAVAAGVDQIAHLPGYGASTLRSATRSRYELDPLDAAAGARRGLVVSPTVSMAAAAADEARFEAIRELQRDNLRLLLESGVRLVIGSDANTFSFTRRGVDARSEARYIRDLGVLADHELLRIWVEDTPRSIFPDRNIGRLTEGFEATFLVLRGNPLEDWSLLDAIGLRVKNGLMVESPDGTD